MVPILYFFPGAKALPEHIRNRFGRFTVAKGVTGPDGAVGLLASRFDGRLAYSPQSQRWDPIGDYYVGADMATTPEMLLRSQHQPGRYVALADGNDWLIPVANPFATTCTLPVYHRMNRQRVWENVIHDQFVALSAAAAEVAATVREAFLAGHKEFELPLDDGALRQLMADAIAVNYDVTLEELSVLRVFTPDVYWPVAYALIDFDDMREVIALAIQEAANGSPPLSAAADMDDTCNGGAE